MELDGILVEPFWRPVRAQGEAPSEVCLDENRPTKCLAKWPAGATRHQTVAQCGDFPLETSRTNKISFI